MKRIRSLIAVALAGSLSISIAKPARSQAQVLAPALCSTGIGCVLVGTAIVGGILVYVWQNNHTNTTYHVPVYQSRPRKPRVSPGQQELFPTGDSDIVITTSDHCKEIGGWRFVPDRSLGLDNGRNIGRCYIRKQGG